MRAIEFWQPNPNMCNSVENPKQYISRQSINQYKITFGPRQINGFAKWCEANKNKVKLQMIH